MKSAEARLHAIGMFHTTASRRRASHVRVVGLRLERIPEEDEEVDLALGDQRAQLLVAAERPALQLLDGLAELPLEERPGGTRRPQLVAGRKARL